MESCETRPTYWEDLGMLMTAVDNFEVFVQPRTNGAVLGSEELVCSGYRTSVFSSTQIIHFLVDSHFLVCTVTFVKKLKKLKLK